MSAIIHFFRHTTAPGGRPTRQRRRGFTLVEMLIVIGIVALLAGIMIPVYQTVRKKGQQVGCASNLKQLGMAFQMYVKDYGNRYPAAGTYYKFGGVDDWTYGGHWVTGLEGAVALAQLSDGSPTGNHANVSAGALYPYVKNDQVYVCPANQEGKDKGLSYSMNCAITGLTDFRIKKPEQIVLLVDEEKNNDGYFYAVDDEHAGAFSDTQWNSIGTNQSNSTDSISSYHNGGNLLFCDFHVKFVPNGRYDEPNKRTRSSFPLDETPEGKANKWKMTGDIRFHDPAFGPWGSNKSISAVCDYCNATKRDPGT